MQSMQSFYDNLFVPGKAREGYFAGLWRIAHASLKDILALRSELAWEQWEE